MGGRVAYFWHPLVGAHADQELVANVNAVAIDSLRPVPYSCRRLKSWIL